MPFPEAAPPLERTVEIVVQKRGIRAETEPVVGVVSAGVDRVTVVDLVGNSHVDIAEIGRSVVIAIPFRQKSQHPVGIGHAAAQDEGRFALLVQRALQMGTAGEQTQTQ